jgi:bifunctional DNA-binding transcriptional regulator/antitoxin component of YhaV-PrlF toxin-antitoxin module
MNADGQVTIPRELREKAGLLPDTEVEFELDGEAVRIRRAHASELEAKQMLRGDELIHHMQGRATGGLTTDEIMALTRGE